MPKCTWLLNPTIQILLYVIHVENKFFHLINIPENMIYKLTTSPALKTFKVFPIFYDYILFLR